MEVGHIVVGDDRRTSDQHVRAQPKVEPDRNHRNDGGEIILKGDGEVVDTGPSAKHSDSHILAMVGRDADGLDGACGVVGKVVFEDRWISQGILDIDGPEDQSIE